MSKEIRWGVFDGKNHVDVAPVGHRHDLDTGACWCNPRVERAPESRPLVSHSLRVHEWFTPNVLGGRHGCKVCGVIQNAQNADGICKGPARIRPRVLPSGSMRVTHELEQALAEVSRIVDAGEVTERLRDLLERQEGSAEVLTLDETSVLLAYARAGRWAWFLSRQD